MKTGWERRQPYIAVDRDRVAALLAPVFPGQDITGCELVKAGLVNSNYRVDLGEVRVLVRIYARDPIACPKEAALAGRFGAILPIPEVLHADASCRLLAHPYAIHRWVEGVRADELVNRGEGALVARLCGTLLATLQRQEFEAPGFLAGDLALIDPGPLTPAFYTTWMREWVRETAAASALGEALAERVIGWADAHAPLIAGIGHERSLVHSDFNGANILLQPAETGWEIAALLDWEFAFSGTSLFDVANMVRHYTVHGAAFVKPFIDAFDSAGGRLPPRWLDTARTLDLMSLVGFLARADCGATIRRDVLALVNSYLDGGDEVLSGQSPSSGAPETEWPRDDRETGSG